MAKKSSFFKDFKAFISKGNILDMAVGVIIGGAFGKIVSSLVADIITPLLSLAMGGVNFAEKYVTLVRPEGWSGEDPLTATLAKEAGFAILTWGAFVQTVIDFLVIALCIFFVLRAISKASAVANRKKLAEEEAKAAEAKAKADAEAAAKAEEEAKAAAHKAALDQAILNEEKLLAEIKELLAKK